MYPWSLLMQDGSIIMYPWSLLMQDGSLVLLDDRFSSRIYFYFGNSGFKKMKIVISMVKRNQVKAIFTYESDNY
jgi:hypothetical protein